MDSMGSGITESTIDAIKVRTVLSGLIESYGIEVRRSGIGAKKACCPFHKEKTPSFSINDDKGYYHCFGCGESGDAIKFVQKMEGLTFVEAVKKLAGRCGVIIEEKTFQTSGRKPTTQVRNQKENENMENIDSLKTRFTELLKSTNRPGMDKVLDGLEKLGFFDAPASSKHHLAEKGGLLQHSMNVYEQAALIREVEVGMKPGLADKLPNESIIVAALLHDVCKSEIYRVEFKNRKNEQTGQWEKVPAYVPHYEHCPMGHGEKSVIRLLRMGLELTNDEILAIRWHMGAWDLSDSFETRGNFNEAGDKCPLLNVIMAADMLASRITEVK